MTENLDVKRAIFRELSATCRPDAILASNTSSISLTRLAAAVEHPERVIGMHFMNPVPMMQLVEVISAFLHGRKPVTPGYSVCLECKRRGNVCVTVAHGEPCLGPVVHAGCGAICPSYNRGCYGCFGPMETPNPPSLSAMWLAGGMAPDEVVRRLRGVTAAAEPFRKESELHEK